MLIAGLVWLAIVGMAIAILWVEFATDFARVASAFGGVTPTDAQILVLNAAITMFAVVTVGYASVGALLAGRPGAGRIAVLLLAGGALFVLVPFGYMVGGSLAFRDPSSSVFSAILLLGPVAIGPGAIAILPALAIAFPDGRLPALGWKWPVRIAVGTVGLGTLLQFIRAGPIGGGADSEWPRNPFGVEALPVALGNLAGEFVSFGIIAMTGLGAVAVVVRYRRGNVVERQQLRWFLACVSLAALPLALSFLPGIGGPGMALVAFVGLSLVPVAVGIAVTRYRLYEIDRLINRTLVYLPLTALLAGLYAAIVALLQRVFQTITGDTSDAAIVISTLILAAVFTPIRKWLEGIVDRRFKPAPIESADSLPDPVIGTPNWDERVAAVALRVVRAELKDRAV